MTKDWIHRNLHTGAHRALGSRFIQSLFLKRCFPARQTYLTFMQLFFFFFFNGKKGKLRSRPEVQEYIALDYFQFAFFV